jgi:hypothetical protein
MPRAAYASYQQHSKTLTTSSKATGATKKTELLEFWQGMNVTNPLKTVIRNVSRVALVLALYMLVSSCLIR